MGLRFWDTAFDDNRVAESHNIVLHALAAGGIPFALATGIGVIGSALSMWRNRTNIPIEWVAAATALLVWVVGLPPVRGGYAVRIDDIRVIGVPTGA